MELGKHNPDFESFLREEHRKEFDTKGTYASFSEWMNCRTNSNLIALAKKFGQPKLTEAELERILPKKKEHSINCSTNSQYVADEFISFGCTCEAKEWNACLKVIRENLRK